MSKVSRKFNLLLILSVSLSVLFSSMSITVYLLIRSERDLHEKDLIHLQGLAENISGFLDHAFTLNYQLSINPDIRKSILEAGEWEERRALYSERFNTGTAPGGGSGFPLLADLQQRYDFVELFFLQDKDGDQCARSSGPLGRRADRWWFKQMAVNQDYRAFLSHSYYSLTGAKPVASIFHPVMDGGRFIGIMGMDINFQKLQELVESYMVLEDMYAIVTDMEGVVIAHPDSRMISEIYNLKEMTRSVLKDKDAAMDAHGYRELETSPLDLPGELSEAVRRAIDGEQGYYDNVLFAEGAQNVYFAPVVLSGAIGNEANYVILLIHDRSPIIRTRNSIFIYILVFIFTIILVLYFLFHKRFRKNILHPLEVLIDSMKNIDFEHFQEIELVTDDEFTLLSGSYNKLRRKLVEANSELKQKVDFLRESESGYKAFSDIGLALSTERNVDRLMELILKEAQNLTRAEGGTLYRYNREQNVLEFSILRNEVMGSHQGGTSGKTVSLPPVPMEKEGKPNTSNVSSFAAVTGKVINISDVYDTEEGFDFSGVQDYDRINNYKSRSMLVIPMKNIEGNLIGVIQLINARDSEKKEVRPFSAFAEGLIISLASQAAVALTNVQLNRDLEELFYAFIRSIAAAIDEKSAYTGGHIRRVVTLTMLIAEELNRRNLELKGTVLLEEEELEELRLAAWMHDIGKITTPESLIDKQTKLEGMNDRIEIIEYRHRMFETVASGGQAVESNPELHEDDLDFLKQINGSGDYLSDEKLARLENIAGRRFHVNGREYFYLNDEEKRRLSIRRGNLTEEERYEIEHHAAMTRRILNELKFPDHLAHVSDYASMHHEKLDGSGYPQGLRGEDIPLQARIISVADIFEALTAKDRPYRRPMKLSRALNILDFMVKDGHIDGDILKSFVESSALTRYVKEGLNPEQIDIDLTERKDLEER